MEAYFSGQLVGRCAVLLLQVRISLCSAGDGEWEGRLQPRLQLLHPVGHVVDKAEELQCAPLREAGGLAPPCALKILTKWFNSARLETRTKESNMYASTRVANSRAQ